MKRKIYMLIISLATAACVAAGLYIHVFSGNHFRIGKAKSAENDVSIEKTINDFQKINVKADSFDVIIKQGSKFSCSYQCEGNMDEPKISEKDGVLTVQQEDPDVHFYFSLTDMKNQIVITVPDGKKLTEITDNNGAGDLTISGVECQKLSVHLTDGDLAMNDMSSDDNTIQMADGDLRMSNVKSRRNDINLSDGDMRITKVTSLSNSVEMLDGDLVLNNVTARKYSVQMSDGDITADHSDLGRITMKTTDGDLILRRTQLDECSVSCADGDVRLSLIGARSDYGFNASTGDGDIIVAGSHQGALYTTEGKDGSKKITAALDSGDLYISFTK